MTTYQDMQDRIIDELQRSDLSSQVRLAIKDAIQFYESERFYFNEQRSSMVTVADQEYYTVTSNFQAFDSLKIYPTPSNTYPLIPRPWSYLESTLNNTNYTGVPTDYAVYGGQLRLYPIPNDAYSIDYAYVYKLSDLSATSDTNSWMTDAEPLIRTRAKIDLLETVIRGPDAQREADRLRLREITELERLRYESVSRRATGKIIPTKF